MKDIAGRAVLPSNKRRRMLKFRGEVNEFPFLVELLLYHKIKERLAHMFYLQIPDC